MSVLDFVRSHAGGGGHETCGSFVRISRPRPGVIAEILRKDKSGAVLEGRAYTTSLLADLDWASVRRLGRLIPIAGRPLPR
jgi:hypothetical protein